MKFYLLDLKVFPANTIRGQERENMKKIESHYNKHYQFIIHVNENYKETTFNDSGRP